MKLQQIGLPLIETKYGGAPTADEVLNDSFEIRDKINDLVLLTSELIDENEKLREAIKFVAGIAFQNEEDGDNTTYLDKILN